MAKRPPASKQPPPPYVGFTRPSLTIDDTVRRWQSQVVEDAVLVRQALFGTVARAVEINASTCARQRLLLLTSGGTSSKTRRLGRDEKAYFTGKTARGRELKSLSYAGAGEPEEVTEHEVLDVLRSPNPLVDSLAWMYQIYWYAEAVGRCYVLTQERAAGVPVSLYVLPPQYTRPQLSKETFIDGYLYGRDQGSNVTYGADEVAYYRARPSPWHPAGALTWAQTIRPQADIEAAAMAAENVRWLNGGLHGAIYKVSELVAPDQIPTIEDGIRRQTQGVGNAGSGLILQHVDVVESATKPHEMNYVPGLELVERQIMHAAGIPEPLYRMNAANLASAEVAMRQYATYTVLPRITSFAAFLTNSILPLYGVKPGEMWFEYADPSPENLLEQEAMYRNGYTAGLIYTNEYRRVLELDPVEDEENTLGPPPQAAPPTPGPFGFGISTGRERNVVGDATPTPAAAAASGSGGDGGAADSAGVDKAGPGVGVARRTATVRELKRVAAARDFVDVTGLPDNLRLPVDRFAAEMQAWYESVVPTIGPDATGLTPEQSARLDAIISDNLARLFEAGGLDFAREIGEEAYSVSNQLVSQYVRARGLELAVTVQGTVLEDVRGAISRGLEEGRTIAEIQTDIRASAPDLAAYQAERIARTEASFAYNDASRETARDLGAGGKQWELAGGPCPLCEEIAETYPGVVPVDQPFMAADGWTGQTAPRHPNCRCTVTYVWEENDADD